MRDKKAHLGRREEFAGALAGAFGELAQQVFVRAPEKIRLHIGQAKPVARVGKRLDHEAQLGGVDVTLAIALGCEIHNVDHAGQQRIELHDCAHGLGEVLTDVLRLRGLAVVVERPLHRFASADDRPACHMRQVEAEQ